MRKRIIGIMGAMQEEVIDVVKLLSETKEFTRGMRTYYVGKINDIQVVVVFSRWGKVAAATTVTNLILEFNITELIFTGVAGAINADLKIGDLVIGRRFIQHDMDARPIMHQYEIPLLNITYFKSSEQQLAIAISAVQKFVSDKHFEQAIGKDNLNHFDISIPKVFIGDIASGDKFFSSNKAKHDLLSALPEVMCVEMEGAAVAQACYEYDVPFIIIRTISDDASEKSGIDFPLFIEKISSIYSAEIVKNIVRD